VSISLYAHFGSRAIIAGHKTTKEQDFSHIAYLKGAVAIEVRHCRGCQHVSLPFPVVRGQVQVGGPAPRLQREIVAHNTARDIHPRVEARGR